MSTSISSCDDEVMFDKKMVKSARVKCNNNNNNRPIDVVDQKIQQSINSFFKYLDFFGSNNRLVRQLLEIDYCN